MFLSLLQAHNIMNNYQQIFENNRKWVTEKKASDNAFFEKLSKDQQPGFLYIGCSDSRVPAEEITGARPGEMLVHRNVANQVDPSDSNAMSVIHFAVTELHVSHIVVCGHYMCGGIKAAMEGELGAPLGTWLQPIRVLASKHRNELEAIDNLDGRFRRLVEINVQAQCETVVNLPVTQELFWGTGFPQVHGWVFNMHTGELIDLNFQP
jgi:carbonic anhydrase